MGYKITKLLAPQGFQDLRFGILAEFQNRKNVNKTCDFYSFSFETIIRILKISIIIFLNMNFMIKNTLTQPKSISKNFKCLLKL